MKLDRALSRKNNITYLRRLSSTDGFSMDFSK